MKRLDELFNKARKTPPPLAQKEAEEIINSSPAGIHKAGKTGMFKIALLAVMVIIVMAGTIVILNTGKNNNTLPTESAIAEKQEIVAENLNSLAEGYKKTSPISHTTTSTGNQLNKQDSIVNVSRLTNIAETKPALVNNVTTKPISTEETIITEVLTETVPASPAKTESVPVIATEETPVPFDSVSSFTTIDKTDDSTISTTTSTTAKKPAPPEHFPRILLKTDLVGYVYNSIENRKRPKYSGFDVWPYWGNSVNISTEVLFSRRLSLEITGKYGFTYNYLTGGTAASYKDHELFINYKGWLFSMGAKYFIIKGRNAGAGLYIGPFASVGYLQERYLYFERTVSGENKASTVYASRGKTIGLGVYAGYRLMYKNWFVEPSYGRIIDGKNKGYFNNGQTDEGLRLDNLIRGEFSIGYKF